MKKISYRQQLIDLVTRRPGLTASEYAQILGRTGPRDTSRVASTLYKLSVTEKILYRKQEPDSRALPHLCKDPVAYTLYKLTGDFKGGTAHRYYPSRNVEPDALLNIEPTEPNLL